MMRKTRGILSSAREVSRLALAALNSEMSKIRNSQLIYNWDVPK